MLFVCAAASAQTLPKPDHIVIVFEENKSFEDVTAANAPFLMQLAKDGASLKKMFAFHHPSQANYIEFFAGTDTVTIDGKQHEFCNDDTITKPSSTPTLGGAFVKKGLTFTGFAEDLALAAPGKPLLKQRCFYVLKHCPWIDFTDSIKFSADFKDFDLANLPTFAMVIPNLIDDMHSTKGTQACKDGPDSIKDEIVAGNDWLEKNLKAYVDFAMKNNSLLIVTFDESGKASSEGKKCDRFQPPKNHIATIFIGPMVKKGFVSMKTYNHHDLLRTIEDMYGLDHVGESATAKVIDDIWK